MARILIVDDDADVVEACRLLLENEGHTVVAAYSRDEGMRAAATSAPQLLILDVMMEQPDDGIAMAQELRRQGFGSPIVMLTSIARVTGHQFRPDPEVLPVDRFIEKPVDGATLVAAVAALLGKGAPACS